MARDNAQEARDNLNRGIPEASGLDDTARAALEAQLDDRTGIAVNSFADLQRGTVTSNPKEGPFNPLQDPDETVTPGEHDLARGIDSPEAAREAGGKGRK